MALQDQLHFEALSNAQQIYQLVLAANPLFAMTQAKFESLSVSQQLYQLLLALQGGGSGPSLSADNEFLGNNNFTLTGGKSFMVSGLVDGFVQINVDAFKVFANNSTFQGHDAAQVVFTLQNAAGQTVHLQDWKDDGGSVMSFVNALGVISAPEFIGPLTGNSSSTTKLTTARNINGVAFDGTGNITIPVGNGYALFGGFSNSAPADAATYFFGSVVSRAINLVEGQCRIYIPKAGTIKAVEIQWIANTVGTAEAITISLRLNATTDTAIATVADANAVKRFTNTALNIAVALGDFFEFKMVCPTWATNPATVTANANVYIE